MSDSSDFTFCQVDTQVNDNRLASPQPIPNIGNITLDDSSTDDVNHKIDNAAKSNRLHDNEIKHSRISGLSSSSGGNVELSRPKVAEKSGDAQNGVQVQTAASKKPAVRAKVPFEKGHSQMDWLKLTRTDPDLAGLKGQSNRRLISMAEVKQHKSEGPIWTVLKGRVYNISPYIKFHPGGADMLMKAAGKDCTALFNKYHAWVNAEFLLEKCLVGVLDDSS